MKNKSITFTFVLTMIFTYSNFAQETTIPTQEKINLRQLSIEQKLDRTVMNLAAFIIGGIAYAKSLGQTPEDFGVFMGKVFAPGWEGTKGKGIAIFIENMYKNFQSDKNCTWEILKESEKLVQVKMKRFGNSAIKDFGRTGVTALEYDQCIAKFMQTITNYLGFYFNQGSQDDWIIFWISTEKEIFKQ